MARHLIVLPLALLLLLVPALALHAGGMRARSSTSTPARLTTVTVGMGYVPNVQFAPLYVAQQRGYYRQAGLDVHFVYGSSPNLLQLVAAGHDTFAYADGTDVVTAAAQGLTVTYIAALFRTLPVAIFSLSKNRILGTADLRSKTIGIPGRFGSTYVGVLAALHQAGLSSADVTLRTIGFTQDDAVVQGTVQAAVGYSNNDTVVLQRHGYTLNVIDVGSTTHIVGPGLVGGPSYIKQHPSVVRHFVQATMHGLADTIASPQAAFAISRTVHGLTTLRGTAAADQHAVLLRSIALWHGGATRAHGLGYIDLGQWRHSVALLKSIGYIKRSVGLAAITTNRFTSGSPKR